MIMTAWKYYCLTYSDHFYDSINQIASGGTILGSIYLENLYPNNKLHFECVFKIETQWHF